MLLQCNTKPWRQQATDPRSAADVFGSQATCSCSIAMQSTPLHDCTHRQLQHIAELQACQWVFADGLHANNLLTCAPADCP